MSDFASTAMVRVLHAGMRSLGLDAPALPLTGARVSLDDKRRLVQAALAQGGWSALLRIGQGVQAIRGDPVHQALVASRSPAELLARWCRLERYIHSRHRLDVQADGAALDVSHRSLRAGEPPLPHEDLVVLGVLVAAIDGAAPELRRDAALYLLDQPPLIAALTADHTATLRRASQRGDRFDDTVLGILARQHGPAWRDVLATRPAPTLSKPLRALADHDLEAETAAGALADLIAQTPGEYAPLRIAAAERCERLHGKRLVEFSMYSIGRSEHGWQLLATACRTGTPTP